jgi:hypothetical protein
MARQQIKQYVFTPAGAGVGKVIIPGNWSNAQLIAILNTTKQTFIYNFADSTLLGTVTWSSTPDVNFPQSIDGITTITLSTSTSTMSAGDKLAIYIEASYPQQRPFATDAVERLRVANPQSLIDADFEYGLQNTKWQSLFVNNDNPSIFEIPGSDTFPNVVSYAGYIGNTLITTSNIATISNGLFVGNNTPNWTQNDYALIHNTDPVGKLPTTAYLTSNVASLNQSVLAFSGNVGAFAVGDNVLLSYFANTTALTCATGNLAAGTAIVSVVGANTIANGTMLMFQTGNTTSTNGFVTEMMAVLNISANSVPGATSANLTVVRNRLGTNPGNAQIINGYAVHEVGNTEIANVVSITSRTGMTVQRAYMNTWAVDNMPVGTVITKLHWDAAGTSGTNTEIVKMTTIGTGRGNIAQFGRGQLGTSVGSVAFGAGSLLLRLTGIFVAGTADLPRVGINIPAHQFVANSALSTQNHTNPNSEGQYQINNPIDINYFNYYPRRVSGFNIGFPLNRSDTYIRYAGFYGTASLPPVVLTTDGGTPSTITATAAYAHGLSPGTPILANVASAGANGQYAHGAFTILSIPTPSTFTYQARAGAAVTGSVVGVVYVRPSAFFTHRSGDGGVLLGTGTPHTGASASRQSKKYFRYQSGKGMMWTSGTLLGANYDIVQVSASGTGVGNAITITTDTQHGLQIGANVKLSGIDTSGYNNFYLVTAIIGDYTFQCNVTSTLGNTGAIAGGIRYQNASPGPKLAVRNWIGSSVRAGMLDDQNGLYWENTGVNINVVQRSSTQQTSGYISVEVGTNLLTGDGSTRFTQEYRVSDKVVLRGMVHTITSVIDDNQMTIAPVWRGLTNQTRIKPFKRTERRYPQPQWNVDPLDGLGQSGYLLDPTLMQMLMIQYTWYGAGFVDFGVRGPLGNYIFAHRFMNNNLNYEAYMRSGNLPARYQAVNDAPYAVLTAAMDASQTTFDIQDATQFPTPTPTSPVYVMIDNEILKCTGETANVANSGVVSATITGVTRASTFNLWQDGSAKSFSAGTAATHAANVSVRIISTTCAPALNHWGSAVILDGGFDVDRGYAYTYSLGNIAFPPGGGAANTTVTAFALRLAPSVSNQIPGDLGTRDLVNRAQLILNNMLINFSGANIGTTVGARYLIEGILNPNNVSTTATTWSYLFNSPYNATANPSGSIQPSYTQVANGNIAGVGAYAGQISFTGYTQAGGGVSYARGGERLFAIPVNYTNSGQLDLTMVKQLGNSGIPGFNIYPDGPELLCINITAIVPTPGISVTGEVQVQWSESQA